MSETLPAQIAKFIGSGVAQLLFDWSVFSLTYAALGDTTPSNILGRISGACLGFWINGRFTFAATNKPRLGSAQFSKFLIVWIALTAVSTIALYNAERNMSWANIYVLKAFIEAMLAVISFTISKWWIYR